MSADHKFKVGDRVEVKSREEFRNVGTVTHVTPTGRITVGAQKFKANGGSYGSDIWGRLYIEPITPERERVIIQEKKRRDFEGQIREADLDCLSFKKLERIVAIIQEVEP